MLSLLTKNNKLVIKNNALLAVDPDSPSARAGFQAFDGSNRYFRRLKFWDIDCCYLFPQIYFPDDGTFTIEKVVDDCCCSICKVVECERWFCCALPVNTIVPCPPKFNQVYLPDPMSCLVPPPAPRKFWLYEIKPSPFNTPTRGAIIINESCCNPDGSKVYIELFDEIL